MLVYVFVYMSIYFYMLECIVVCDWMICCVCAFVCVCSCLCIPLFICISVVCLSMSKCACLSLYIYMYIYNLFVFLSALVYSYLNMIINICIDVSILLKLCAYRVVHLCRYVYFSYRIVCLYKYVCV